jgi:hypothetical protein
MEVNSLKKTNIELFLLIIIDIYIYRLRYRSFSIICTLVCVVIALCTIKIGYSGLKTASDTEETIDTKGFHTVHNVAVVSYGCAKHS